MCGIVGVFGDKKGFDKVALALKKIKYRGKDISGICSEKGCVFGKEIGSLKRISGTNFIGHNLHAVVNKVKQPIKKKGILVANCEIYNWQELRNKYKLQSRNDSELLLDLMEKKGLDILDELDGVYAFAYWRADKLYLARDIIGVKPLWYSFGKSFAFASERKALESIGCTNIEELNPRTILEFDIRKGNFNRRKRKFFRVGKLAGNKDIRKHTKKLLLEAIEKRLPEGRFGILFSGGIDSAMIAFICRKLGKDFICYTSALEEESMQQAPDLIYAERAAKKFGLKLKIRRIKLSEVEDYLKKLIPLIEDSNVVKAGVGLTFYAACEAARKDKIRVIFSGLGSEEIFAGYERHKLSGDINKECLSGLLKMYERDLYRDDVITMYHNLELRLPFLDKKMVGYALTVPPELKINNERNKIILRDIAKEMGIPEEFAERKKKAAQYGSKFDRAIGKLAKKKSLSKSRFLRQFYQKPNIRLGVLWSGGKDSSFAAWIMKSQNYELACLISMKSTNPDSYMFHTPNIDMVELQSKAMDIPIVLQSTEGRKEKELEELRKAIEKAKTKYKIEGIVTGAIFSNYQRERIERICDEVELKVFSPLWHLDQLNLMKELLKNGFEIVISSVAAYGLSERWLGRKIDSEAIEELDKINKRVGINIAFEGGEAETLVTNSPLFKKRIIIIRSKKIMENECTGRYLIEKAELAEK